MSEARDTRVFYRAMADFANVKKELRELRNEMAKTQAAEKAFNASSAKDRAAATRASTARVKALKQESSTLKTTLTQLSTYRTRQNAVTTAVKATNVVINAQNRSLLTNNKRLSAAALAAKEYASAQRSISKATGMSSDAIRAQKEFAKAQKEGAQTAREQTEALKEQAVAHREAQKAKVRFVAGVGDVDRKTGEVVRSIEDGAKKVSLWRRAFDNAREGLNRFRGDGDKLPPTFRKIESGGDRLFRSLQKFGNWRPRFTPPFVALIPIIGAVIAAINPLISIIGALGGAAIGLAGQIGSLSGVFLALPGILSGVVAGIAGVIASMGGVGNVFKTYSAMQKALGKAPGGQSQADRADATAAAERGLAKAQRQVQKAQENLNKAREQALKDLIDLRIEVGRASLTEERAIADLQLAREAYNNVQADPGSTAGDKLDAAAAVKEAEAELEDVRRRNIEAQNELSEAERKGVDQAERVVDAQESLADAYEAQKDAQKSLNTEAAGGSAAVDALSEYNEALAALSPSARTFVLALIGLQDQWKAMRSDMQESFFSQFTDDLDELPQIIKNIGNFLRPAVISMGRFAGAFLRLFGSPEWSRDLATIGEQNGVVVRNLGDAFLSLATFLKDVTLAAGPFTEWLTNGMAEGAENWSKFLDTEEERDSLAGWLDTVAERMGKWWQIVKNIGATIFNYSAAAAGFGDWISDGFLEMTENWRAASEAAREPNSAFQTWLENIKPLLSEVDRLLGAFFSWFGREAADTGNIESAINILKILTDEVGPALGRLLDTLASTNIDEAFLQALTSIIESVDTILENGGSASFETFFAIVTGAFDALATAISIIPKPVLEGLLSLLGFIAGVTFIGKFTGLTALLGKIVALPASKMSTVTSMFTTLDGLKFAGFIALATALAIIAASSFAKVDAYNASLGDTSPEGLQTTIKEGGKNGAFFRTLGNVPGTNASLTPGIPSAGQGVGFLAEFLHGWDDLWGNKTSFGTDFENMLDDAYASMLTFSEDKVVPWLEQVGITWDDKTQSINFDGMWKQINTGFNSFMAGWYGPWNNFWSNLPTAVSDAAAGMTAAWEGIQNGFATPVNWVITNVWNNGLRSFWNGIANKLGFAELPAAGLISSPAAASRQQNAKRNGSNSSGGGYARGGVLPGYSPGYDNMKFSDGRGNNLNLSGGEGILIPQATRMLGGERGIDNINRKARSGTSFAKGGVIGDIAKSVSGLISGAKSGTDALLDNPLKFIGDGLRSIVNPLTSGMSGNGWSGMMKAVPGKLIDNMLQSVTKSLSAQPTGKSSGSAGMGWAAQWAAIQNSGLSGIRLNDGGIRKGSAGYHGKGRAIDITPSMAAFKWIRDNFPNSSELIYSPANGQQLRNGANYMWPEPVRSNHFDHVHWAMKNGGVFDRTQATHDNGGWLRSGEAAVNLSGKPEAVLTNEESQGLKRLLGASGLSARPAFGASAATAITGTPSRVVDNSINVEKLILNNPVPEKPSVSMAKGIRNIGYMNLARTGESS